MAGEGQIEFSDREGVEEAVCNIGIRGGRHECAVTRDFMVHFLAYCGLDPQDALKLPRTAVSGGKIDARRGKTGEALWIPLPSPVAEALARSPKHDAITLCANSYGRPWTVAGFSASWKKVRGKLLDKGEVRAGLTLKGLRHTVATILSEMGYDERTIADMLAQKTIEMARHYSRRADKSRKLTAVVESSTPR